MFSLLAENQPEYKRERDNRSWDEIFAQLKSDNDFDSKSDEEIEEWAASLAKSQSGSQLSQAVAEENRIRRNAKNPITSYHQHLVEETRKAAEQGRDLWR